LESIYPRLTKAILGRQLPAVLKDLKRVFLMTTFAITGFTVIFEDTFEGEAIPTEIRTDTDFSLFVPEGVTSSFSYTNTTRDEDEDPIASLTADDAIRTALNGQGLGETEEFFIELT
jgi:hypothetical protein